MVERGVGLWLVRSGEGADVEKPFYVSGQYEAVAGNTTVVGGSAAAPTWTLLANPDRTVATDLNAIKWEGNPVDIKLPAKMVFVVAEGSEGIKGDTVTKTTKPVKTETGLVVKVPLFIKEGEKILVSTETGEYQERVNK